MRYYKVLKNGKSFHGGDMSYPLPVGDQPGEWVKHDGDISACQSGLHVTTEPARWMTVGAEVFEAEIRGEILPCDAPDKFVCRELRLIKKLSESELIPLNVFSSGTHEIKNSYAFCYNSSTVYASGSSTVNANGSSTVDASDSSTVYAYGSRTVTARDSSTVYTYNSSTVYARDSSTVRAYGSSTVTARDSSTITAYGSSTLYAYGSSTIIANGSSTVDAYGSSTVYASDSSTVHANGSSTVHAYESSCVTIKSKSVKFTCKDCAVIIDRSNHGKPVVTIGEVPK